MDLLKKYIKNEILFNIESLVNENYMENDKECKKLENITNKDIKKIIDNIYNDKYFIENLNETLNEYIQNELYNFLYN